MTAAVVSETEAALWLAVGSNPADSLPRLVLADHLDETATTVKCGNPNCKGEGGWGEVDYKEFGGESRVWRKCPACQGTGYTPDGRADLADALRSTADRVPLCDLPDDTFTWFRKWDGDGRGIHPESDLPAEVYAKLNGEDVMGSCRAYPTAADAIRDLCRAHIAVHRTRGVPV